ncbi:hypothetical protein F4778DRAFT_775462 [Xylariomycetidae sp. FL2044]|nr:hypothetical protein F4778DRAFT_775462 [Xylariomycetidae sp. FL2044]
MLLSLPYILLIHIILSVFDAEQWAADLLKSLERCDTKLFENGPVDIRAASLTEANQLLADLDQRIKTYEAKAADFDKHVGNLDIIPTIMTKLDGLSTLTASVDERLKPGALGEPTPMYPFLSKKRMRGEFHEADLSVEHAAGQGGVHTDARDEPTAGYTAVPPSSRYEYLAWMLLNVPVDDKDPSINHWPDGRACGPKDVMLMTFCQSEDECIKDVYELIVNGHPRYIRGSWICVWPLLLGNPAFNVVGCCLGCLHRDCVQLRSDVAGKWMVRALRDQGSGDE